ncbi:MAG: GGDEF domain-containing protein [Bacilli bacterium]|nr:GGDEF domain-containing protein [Bacilli bacterium]
MLFARIAIILEMLLVNLFTAHICSKKRFNNYIIVIVHLVFTALVAFVFRYFNQFNSNPYDGSGIMTVFGFLFLIPLTLSYKQQFKYTFLIMTYSWIYTLLIFSFSFRIGELFGDDDTAVWLALIIQTGFFGATIPLFLKIVKDKFLFILNNVDSKAMNLIVLLSFSFFCLIAIGNYSSVRGLNEFLSITILILFALSAVTSYRVFYMLVAANKHARALSERVKIDSLTKVKNRVSMYEDAQKLIDEEKMFTIVYIDLDDFKAINDKYGHQVGDDYLINFVNLALDALNLSGNLYRMSGDEFIIIHQGDGVSELCSKFSDLKFSNEETKLAFRGLSWGSASYPAEGNNLKDLLNKADLDMYEEKKEKYRDLAR